MKKLWPAVLAMVMVIASCDQYSEEEYCPISLDTVYADPNSIVMTVFVNESYLQLYHCELGAVCSTSNIPSDMGARPDFLTSLGNGKYELKFGGDFSAPKYYIHLYTASHESGKARYHDCIEVVMDDVPNVPDGDSFINLSANGTANCYIVNRGGKYKFRPVKGNSDETLDVKSVEVLWESFGTDVAPNVGDLIKLVSYKDGYIAFETNTSFKEGNAVIAAKDASGTILWSWHIWLTDQPEEQVYYNNAGTMMDRNLGATSATPGDVGALGLLYQWGRKDPFLGSSSISESVEAASSIVWPSAIDVDSYSGTIEYTIAYPTTFILSDSGNCDWYYTGSELVDNTRWQSFKTIYDPCPYGWRVPDGGSDGVWAKASGNISSDEYVPFDNDGKGMNLTGILGPDQMIWYPATGQIASNWYTGSGQKGYCWTVTPFAASEGAYRLYFTEIGKLNVTSDGLCRFRGYSVRCIKE